MIGDVMSKKKSNRKNKNNKKEKNINKIKTDKQVVVDEVLSEEIRKKRKKFCLYFLIWICILGVSLLRKPLQNDTLYTIKIGELILDNGIDMMDHFSFHTNLAYTYPHWLYDVFIYLVYAIGGLQPSIFQPLSYS